MDLNLLLILILYRGYLRRNNIRRPRRAPIVWMKDYLKRRTREGQYYTLLRHLKDPTSVGHAREFYNYMRMDSALFEEILNRVGPHIERQNMNYGICVSAGEQLAITLRFLATGDNYPTLQAAYRVNRSNVSKIVIQTCQAIIDCYIEQN